MEAGSKSCGIVQHGVFNLHASSGATHWETGWSVGPNGPVGTRASCLSSGPVVMSVIVMDFHKSLKHEKYFNVKVGKYAFIHGS